MTCIDPNKCDYSERIAKLAADEAVCEVFSKLGIDVDDPKQVEEFRQDLRLAGKLRQAADKGFVFVIMTGLVIMLSAAWFGIAQKFTY